MSLQIHCDFTSVSLRFHFNVTWAALWFRFGASSIIFDPTSTSLRLHADFTLISLRVHFDLISVSLRCHFDSTSASFRIHCDFTLVALRFHFDHLGTPSPDLPHPGMGPKPPNPWPSLPANLLPPAWPSSHLDWSECISYQR